MLLYSCLIPSHFYFIVEHLITPELWLKNCRTRSTTPEQEQREHHQKRPSPSSCNVADDKVMKSLQPSHLPPSSSSMSSAKITSSVANLTHSTDNCTKKQPLINVLPSSKLLSRNMLHHKSLRKRRVSARLAMNTGAGTNGSKLNQNANSGISSCGERIMNTNFPSDMRATQMNNGSKAAIQSPSLHRAPPPLLAPNPLQQFMQRPPINLFKFRLPFPPQHHRMPMLPQHLPPEDPNYNPLYSANPLLPPSVVLVPYPIPLPIIIPIPLPLSAFMRAYQTKGSSKIPSNENHNESQEVPVQTCSSRAKQDDDMRVNENEQPLDLSSEQGVCCDIDKEFLTQQLYHNNNNNDVIDDDDDDDTFEEYEDDGGDDNDIRKALSGNKKNDSLDRIPKFEITRVDNQQFQSQHQQQQQQHHVKKDSLCESNRPLRKRKIIATEEVSESQ